MYDGRETIEGPTMEKAKLQSYFRDYLRSEVLPKTPNATFSKTPPPDDIIHGAIYKELKIDGIPFATIGFATVPELAHEFVVVEVNPTAVSMSTWRRIRKGKWECTGAKAEPA